MSFSSWWKGLGKNPSQSFKYFFFPLGGGFSESKITDTQAIETGYMSSEKWYSVVRKAAGLSSSLPYKLATRNSKGELEEVKDGELYDKIFNPNENQSLKELWEQAFIFYFNTGDAFFYSPIEAIGFPSNTIINLPSQMVDVNLINEGSILSKVKNYTLNDTKQITILPEEMLHIMMINPSKSGMVAKDGLSPLNPGLNKLNASNNASTAQASYFENRGVSNIISQDSGAIKAGVTMNDADKKDINNGLRNMIGGAKNSNGVYVTKSPITVHQLGASSSDMQMIESDVQLMRNMANLLDMPSVLFNDPQNSTYANFREAVKVAYNDVAIPHGQKFVDGYNRTIVKEYSKLEGKDYVFYIDKKEIDALKPTREEYEKSIDNQVKAGVISRQEARMKLGYEPYTGDGAEEMETPTIQTNLIPISDAGKTE